MTPTSGRTGCQPNRGLGPSERHQQAYRHEGRRLKASPERGRKPPEDPVAAHDPDVRRAAAIKANAELWLTMTPEQRRAHMASVADGMRRNLAQQIDPNGELDPAERDRRVALKRKQVLAAARAKGTATMVANAAERRRRKADDELDNMIVALAELLVDLAPAAMPQAS